MKSDPLEDIIKILYGQLEGKIFSIIKSKKKVRDTELISILTQSEKIDINNINTAINLLKDENFIESGQINNEKHPKAQKNKNQEIQLTFNEHYNVEDLFYAYTTLKNDIKKYFESEEELKYECEKCKKKYDENMASRDNLTCPKCGERYKKIKNNLMELKKRCYEILEILDERFDLKLGGLNSKSHAKNMDYLKSKYGNNVFINNEFKNIERDKNGMIILENDPYVQSTLEDITKTEKKAEKFAFYELIEAFKKIKKK